MTPSLVLITPTWAGDLGHFKLLRASLQRSGLCGIEHRVVVQTEDVARFRTVQDGTWTLLSTAEVLPAEVEHRRCRAKRLEQMVGRDVTRLAGSLARRIGWPQWPGYTGWHTQQIAKLKLAAESGCEYAVILDSDVIVCPDAQPADLLPAGSGIACYATWAQPGACISKVRNWIRQADRLIGASPLRDGQVNHYFDTPFLLHVPTLNALFAWLEAEQGQPWWKVMFAQPPRRWSEFATYKAFLARLQAQGEAIQWLDTQHIRYIFDASDTERLKTDVAACFRDPHVKFVTIHSQSTGRQLWSVEQWGADIDALIRHPR
ncbi:MAG: DUF6492 family protein [Gammaproteobacteria bacterium]|nr:DUF6492 family protein [Gammaproteobacteria bacterium]